MTDNINNNPLDHLKGGPEGQTLGEGIKNPVQLGGKDTHQENVATLQKDDALKTNAAMDQILGTVNTSDEVAARNHLVAEIQQMRKDGGTIPGLENLKSDSHSPKQGDRGVHSMKE